jgi:2-C-methyl-D-erythritol 4-phosphate cytidylyltransferase
MNKYVIIVAGGTGVRMGSTIPKQFMLLHGTPILMWAVEAFSKSGVDNIIIVIPPSFINYWENLCTEYSFVIKHKVVAGGLFRSQSVKNGLDLINEKEALVAVHDGVRPLVSKDTINLCYSIAEENGAAVPFIDINDSIRVIEGVNNRHVERDRYKAIQTPQCFLLSILKRAYSAIQTPSFTDDSTIVEQLNFPISLFKGNPENIKITTPLDLIIAESILTSSSIYK